MNFKLSKYQNLVTCLLLNGHFIENIGLMHGKTGLAIFFYQLAKQTGNEVFETFAGELIDEMTPVLSVQQPVDFENGLAGIGWGIEYMVQNGFLEADTDEALKSFDKQIFKSFLENPPSTIGLLNGALGTGHYFLMRIKGIKQKPKNMITQTNRIALQHVCNHLSLMLQHSCDMMKEPCSNSPSERINKKEKQVTEPVPVFEITWNLPVLLGFAAEIFEQNIQTAELNNLLVKALTPDARLPVLQCNRLLLLLSLIRLKKAADIFFTRTNEINLLAGQIIEEIVSCFDHKRYIEELSTLNPSIRNGISGLALIHKKLYEQTGDLKYKNEYSTLVNKFLPKESVSRFRFDYSNPLKTNESELGLFQGVSGLLLTLLL